MLGVFERGREDSRQFSETGRAQDREWLHAEMIVTPYQAQWWSDRGYNKTDDFLRGEFDGLDGFEFEG